MNQDIERVLYTEEDIRNMGIAMGKKITEDYADLVSAQEPLMVVGLLKGCIPFLAELIKRIELPLNMFFMRAKSYEGVRAGHLTIKMDLEEDVTNRHILIVEDVVDTGNTLDVVKNLLLDRGAASVKVATMMDKKEGRTVKFDADYVGYDCPNEFIVGYGLDFDERYRELPFVGVLKPSVYKK